MGANWVLGERADELMDDLRPGNGVPTGPMTRALLRAEAELMVADAAAMQFGTYRPRTVEQRRADALALVRHRLGEVAQAA